MTRTRILIPTDPDWDPSSKDSMVEDFTPADAVMVLEWVLRAFPADHLAAPAVVGALWTLHTAHPGPARGITQQMILGFAFDELQKARAAREEVLPAIVRYDARRARHPQSVQEQAVELALEKELAELWENNPTAKAKIFVVHEADAPTEDRWLVAARDGRQGIFRDHDEADRVARLWAGEQGGNGLTTEELAERDAGTKSTWSVSTFTPFKKADPA